jgi:hypothetical protein
VNRSVTWNHNYELNYTIQNSDGDRASAVLRFYVTPLAFDLDGDGLEVTTVEEGVLFDYDVDGDLEQTAWLESDDGFLVADNNGDGLINDRSEMFGDMFGFTNGFAHLASYDSNGDGVIDAADEQWSELNVWRDLDQDGVSDEGELFGLDEVGIESISLDAQNVDIETDGGYISLEATYTTTDGEVRSIYDAHMDYDELNAEDAAAQDFASYLVEENIGDVLYGTSGADEFIFDTMTEDSVDVIVGFNAEEGDVVDLSSLLGEYDETQDAIDDFVFQNVEDGHTTISVDVTGSGDALNAQQVVVLDGVSGLDLETTILNAEDRTAL